MALELRRNLIFWCVAFSFMTSLLYASASQNHVTESPAAQVAVAVKQVERPAPRQELDTPDPVETEQSVLAEHLADKYEQPVGLVSRIVKSAYKEASIIGLSPLLVLAIIEQESGLDPTAKSKYGAIGLMQVVPRFHTDELPLKGAHTALKHPETNIRVGSSVLAKYLESTGGNLDKALKQYSGNARGYAQKVRAFKHELETVSHGLKAV